MDKIDVPKLFTGLFDIDERVDDFAWQEFKEGIDIFPIYEQDESGAAAALLRYSAGARAPLHTHTGYEHILILSGTQTDGFNVYSKGMLMISEPGTQHHILSENGCIVLAIWQSPVSFLD